MEDAVWVASGSLKGQQNLSESLRVLGYTNVVPAASGSQLRQLLQQKEPAVLVVNTPLSDERGLELARHFALNSSSGVLLIVPGDVEEELAARVEEYGVCVLGKPLNRDTLARALRLTLATHRRITSLHEQNLRLQKRLEEIRVVERAKFALMQYLNLDEEQAHRYIEKQAMNRRQTRGEIAQYILRMYEV